MKNYRLVRNGAGEALPLNGTVREVRTAEEAVAAVESGELLSAVLIDTPSAIPDIEKLIRCVNDRNSDLLAFPILLLTDSEHIEKDEAFLGGVVVDCVEKPVRAAVLRNRLANAEELVSSVSFTDALALFRSVVALLTVSALFCMVFCRALT